MFWRKTFIVETTIENIFKSKFFLRKNLLFFTLIKIHDCSYSPYWQGVLSNILVKISTYALTKRLKCGWSNFVILRYNFSLDSWQNPLRFDFLTQGHLLWPNPNGLLRIRKESKSLVLGRKPSWGEGFRESPWWGLNSWPHPYQGCALPLSYTGSDRGGPGRIWTSVGVANGFTVRPH